MMKFFTLVLLVCLPFTSAAQNNSFIVWSGGVSFDERANAPTSGTKLVFFVSTGSFLTNMQVSIKSEMGQELVNVSDTGPWLIVDLPDGKYSVIATRSNGDAQGAIINVVSGQNNEFSFRFPVHD